MSKITSITTYHCARCGVALETFDVTEIDGDVQVMLLPCRGCACQHRSRSDSAAAFINALFNEFYPDCGDCDGGALQNLAEKHGISMPEIRGRQPSLGCPYPAVDWPGRE